MFEDQTYIINDHDCMKKELCNLYKTKKFADCQFLIGHEKIKAHKLILAMNSPVFERMLYGPLSSNEISIVDIDVHEFKQMLEFIYLCRISIDSIPNAWKLLYVCKKYFMNQLYQICVNYILNNLSISNFLLSYEYADFFNVQPVLKKCENDIKYFSMEVFQSSYHMKPFTFAKVLSVIHSFVPCESIEVILNNWILMECEIRNCEKTNSSEMKILKETGICRSLLLNQVLSNQSYEVDAIPPFRYLKLRTEYKLDRLIPFKYNCCFITQVKSNRTVLISGVALEVAETCLVNVTNCSVLLSIFKDQDKLYQSKNVPCSNYIKLANSVILNAEESYKFVINYCFFSDVCCGVVSYYRDFFLKNKKNDVIFECIDDPKGSILKGFCYYLY